MTYTSTGWPPVAGTEPPTVSRRWFEPAGVSPALAVGRVPLVLLHEGLGSISSWGSFPQALADACGRRLLAYDRAGYGESDPRPGPWPAEFMHHEAFELDELLRSEGVDRLILVGHSDGATISLLYPSQAPAGGSDVVGIVSLSAHVMVEELNVEVISAMRDTYHDGLARPLARHHRDADTTFDLWSDVWVSDRFRPWAIDAELGAITCPVLAMQGEADAYGTMIQLNRLAAAVAGPVETVALPGVDHWPHKEATDDVIRLTTTFADGIDPR
ncbi:MAG: alpha/beta hydrolase [Actinomycetota bacterium]